MKKKIQRHRRQKDTEPTGECKAIVPVCNEDDVPKEPTEKSCSDQIIGTSDEEKAISHFLHESKKRKLEVADDETDNPVVASLGKKKYKKRHAQTTKRHAQIQEATIKSGKEQASSGDDMTLNCFLRNRSKKRRESGRGDIQNFR